MNKQINENIIRIEKLYYKENKTATEIAGIFGVHRTSIQRALKKNNEDRYLAFSSASGKSNRKENNSIEDWKKISIECLALYKRGWKLKEIAKKYKYDVVHVCNIMKKYQKEAMKLAKEERVKENAKKKIEAREDDVRVTAYLKRMQAANAREMSHNNMLSNYTAFLIYFHLYQRYEDGVYRLKYSVRNQVTTDVPRSYVCQVERDCARYLKRTS